MANSARFERKIVLGASTFCDFGCEFLTAPTTFHVDVQVVVDAQPGDARRVLLANVGTAISDP